MRWPLLHALVLLLLTASPLWANSSTENIQFELTRKGKKIGEHHVTIERSGATITVNTTIAIDVHLGPIRVYTYRHRARETWRSGRLHALDSKTDDNGTAHWVKARLSSKPHTLTVESDSGTVNAPADIVPTSYWTTKTIYQKQLLNTQNGKILDVNIEMGRPKQYVNAFNSQQWQAWPFAVNGDIRLTLWYNAQHEWVGLVFYYKGKPIRYRRMHIAPMNYDNMLTLDTVADDKD